MINPWLYFGCGRGSGGHYLFAEDGNKAHLYGRPNAWLQKMCWDGNLAPQPEPAADSAIYQVSITRLGGWGYTALSWWDRSQDTRPGSNSTILAPHLNIDPVIMLDAAYGKFPWVFARLPRALTFPASPRSLDI